MTSVPAAAPLTVPGASTSGPLPRARNVLVVTARPGQESASLGGLLYAFRRAGACLGLLCLTRGEASPLNSTWSARLEAVRPWERQLAANVLGMSSVAVASYPDGKVRSFPAAQLTERVRRAIRQHSPDLLVVIDPEVGDPDDVAVAMAACAAARQAGLPGRAHRAGSRGRLDDRAGRRRRHRPRHTENRRRRARQSVPGTARTDAPPRAARRAGTRAVAGIPAPEARAPLARPLSPMTGERYEHRIR